MKQNYNPTQWETTARYTTNLRDQVELYYSDPFPKDYDFYTNDVEMKKNFEKKFLDHYWFHDTEWEQFSIYIHYLRSKLNEIMPYYKTIHENKINLLELQNVDITEIIKSESSGSGKSKSTGSGNSESSSSSKGLTKDFDTPQGNVNLDRLGNYVSGLTDNEGSGKGNNTQSNQSESEQQAENLVDTHRTLKGYQGNKTISELKKELIDSFRNIDLMIIEDCKELFLKVY